MEERPTEEKDKNEETPVKRVNPLFDKTRISLKAVNIAIICCAVAVIGLFAAILLGFGAM